MSLGNRTYWREDQGSQGSGGFYGGGGGMGIGLPKPTPAVMGLLIANIVLFVVQLFVGKNVTYSLGAVIPALWWQAWRLITFQFLHNGVFHILINMLMLYFLGIYLERAWGTRRFLVFYLTCGVIAGLTNIVLAFSLYHDPGMILVGASGGVYAVTAACAILFPGIQLIIFIFPVPIRLGAIIMIAISALFMMTGDGGGGDNIAHAAHFGGMVAGGLWVWLGPRIGEARDRARQKINNGAWERKMRQQQADQAEVDRILDKIRREGLQSLSSREKRILQDATEQQRRHDQNIRRM